MSMRSCVGGREVSWEGEIGGGEGGSHADTDMGSISDRGNRQNGGCKAGARMHGLFEEQHENLCGWEKKVRRKAEFREGMEGSIT